MMFSRVRRTPSNPVSPRTLQTLRRAVQIEGLEDRRLFAADLVLQGSPVPTTALTGGIVTYTLTLTNVGDLSAANVHVVDTIPQNTSFFSYNQTAGRPVLAILPPVGSKAPVDFSLGTVTPGEATTVNVMVKVDAAALNGSTFFNVATATTTSLEDPTPDDNKTTSGNTRVRNQAEIKIDAARTVDPTNPSDPADPADAVIAGTDITYTVTITNAGPSVAGNFNFTHYTPNNTTFVSITRVDQGGPALTVSTPQRGYSGIITATSPSFPANGTATFKIVEHVIAAAPAANIGDAITANFTATSAGIDQDLTNNVDVVVATPVRIQADISVSTNTNKLLNPYESNFIDYVVTVKNNGYSDAANVAFSWDIDDQFVPAQPLAPDPAVFSLAEQLTGPLFGLSTPELGTNGTISGTITVLPAGSSATFHFRVLAPEFDVYTTTISATTGSPQGTDQTDNDTYTDVLTVTDAPLVVEENAEISAIVGRPLDRVFLMSFDDYKIGHTLGRHSFPASTFGDNTVLIDWGDGTPLDAGFYTVRLGGVEAINYDLFGSHTYTRGGVFRVKVTVTGDGGSRTFTSSDVVVTGLRPLQTVPNPNAAATLNAFSNITLGTFTNPQGVPNSVYSGTAVWDDGTTSGLTITPSSGGVFTITGTHKFTTPGLHRTFVTVRANDDGGQDTTFQVSVNVVPPPVTPTGVNVTATPGQSTGNVAVATFVDPGDPNVTAPLNSYSAAINWGDGTAATAGVITRDDATGVFTVTGSHTYATAGNRTITTVISHTGGSPNATVTSTATVGVSTPVNTVTVTGQSVSGTPNVALSGVTIATFTATNTALGVAAYSAVIDWGDGKGTSAGTITQTAAGAFTVKGTHTYTAAGTFKPKVTITAIATGAQTSGTGTATIAAAGTNTVTSVSGKTLTATSGTALSGAVVSSFVASSKTVAASGYTAVINWGDGTATSAGTLVQTAAGAFNVKGTHTYTKTGTFKPTVTIKVVSTGKSTPATGTVTVAAPVVLKPAATSLNATLNKAFTGGVGTFTDSKGNTSTGAYKVLIDWGDGTAATTAKLVYNASAKRFDVSGTHTYKAKSPTAGFKVKVSVQALSGASKGSTATINSTAFVK